MSLELIDARTVAQLLQQSRDANDARLRASLKKNYQEAESHAATALALRELAHDADPDHTDSEWSNDKGSHEAIVAFLKQYPSIL